MKAKWTFFIIVSWVILVILFFLDSFNRKGKEEKLSLELKTSKATLDSIYAREDRIDDMTETLIRSYGLDSIRAHFYSTIFDEYSVAYNIPWVVFGAIMRMESNFTPTALSDRSCKGLMQLKEGTMKQMCSMLNIQYRSDVTIWDDVSNIICGITYLHYTAKDKGLDTAINAYVGGPDYLRSIRADESIRSYVVEYNSSITREIDRLTLAYAGVRAINGRK